MLPSLSGLRTAHPAPAATNAFYQLNTDEARRLNEDGGDPITGENFERDRGPDDDGATFRIRSYAADGVTPVYNYFVAESLWEWARRGNRTDPMRRPWQFLDWMAMRNQLEPNYQVPGWIWDLMTREDAIECVRDSSVYHLTDLPARFRSDRAVVLEAVRSDASNLEHAPEPLRADREVVYEAVSQNGYALIYASEDVQKDMQLQMLAGKDYLRAKKLDEINRRLAHLDNVVAQNDALAAEFAQIIHLVQQLPEPLELWHEQRVRDLENRWASARAREAELLRE